MKKIWCFISDIGTELESEPVDIWYIRLLNQFTLIVFFVFFIHSLHNLFYIKDTHSASILFSISLFFILTFLFAWLRRIKLLVCLVFVFLATIIFFYESYSGLDSGITLYYFAVLLAIPFIFNYEKDKPYIISILSMISIFICINIFTDYSLFTNNSLTYNIRKNTFFVSLSISLIITIVDLFFIFKKNQIIHNLYKISVESKTQLRKQKQQIKLLRNDKNTEACRDQELTQLAVSKDPSFFTVFTKIYPSFCPVLLKYAPDLSMAELELCAYIKLNFTTKEIAQYALLSVRAVEGRKFRIRKKLGKKSEKELVKWMMELEFFEIPTPSKDFIEI